MEFNDKKKYCFALDLKNDPEKIQAYIDQHKRVWPEIEESIKNAGINQLEIFHTHNRLFMIIEGNKDSPQVIKDIWVFQKPLKSKNPAWELISTNPDD